MSAALSLAELAARGAIRARDIDVIMVAAGYLSYELVDQYLAQRRDAQAGRTPAPPRHLPVLDVPGAAREVVARICGCQYHDNGRTELVAADLENVHLRVGGACVHCPQIKYTMGVVEGAIRFRAPATGHVHIDGTRFEEKMEIPPNNQLTMGMLMKETGLAFSDLDDFLSKHPRMTDEDLERLAQRSFLRRRLLDGHRLLDGTADAPVPAPAGAPAPGPATAPAGAPAPGPATAPAGAPAPGTATARSRG